MKTVLAVFLFFTFSTATHAQSPDSQTHFAMAGLVSDDTLEIDLLAYSNVSSQPCIATIGFLDSNGLPVGPSWSGTIAFGQTTSLTLSGSEVSLGDNDRAEVLPVVTGGPTCIASAEILQGDTSPQAIVVVPAYYGSRPPAFGSIYVPFNEVTQLTVFAPQSCVATLSFWNEGGTCDSIGETTPCEINAMDVELSAGQSASLETPPTGPLLHPIVAVAKGSCTASIEAFDTTSLESYTYYLPVEANRR
jgi:hypothetical protein